MIQGQIHGYSFSLRSDLRPVGGPSPSRNARCAEARGVRVRDIAWIVARECTSPPILACLLSVPVGCIKPLQVGG